VSDYQKDDYHVVAETVLTSKKIEKFPLEDVALVALTLAELACLAEDFFVGDGPGDRCDWYGQNEQPNELQDYGHGAVSMRWLAGGLAGEGLIARGCDFAPKSFKEGFAGGSQFLFQALGAIALSASPGFRAVLVATAASIMGVLDACQIEILLPIGTFFLKRWGAVADLHPSRGLVWAKACIFHIPEVFAFGNGTFTQGLVVDSFQ
jgi:hypothetical protein